MSLRPLSILKPVLLVLLVISVIAGAPTGLRSDPISAPQPLAKKYDRASIDNGFTPIDLNNFGPLVVVTTTVNGIPNTAIGEITASVTPVPGHTMMAAFTVYPEFLDLCNWVEFHWVQTIVTDACPARIAGVVPPLPHLDPPAYGWDYMYVDQDNPPDGIQADERNPGGVNPMPSSPGFADDIVDVLPWYHTEPEEANDFTICEYYPIDDTPGFCPMNGFTLFRTYLVVRPIGQATFCLLGGFGWLISAAGNGGPVAIPAPDAGDASAVQAALAHGNIPGGWTATAGCEINCQPTAVEGTSWGSVKGLFR